MALCGSVGLALSMTVVAPAIVNAEPRFSPSVKEAQLVTLRDYVLAFARHWTVIASAVVAGLLTAGVAAVLTPPTYHASAQVLFTGHDSASGQDQAYMGGYVQARMATYGKLDSSTRMLTAAAEEIGSGETAETLRARTEIDVTERDTVAVVQVTDGSAEKATHAANAVAAAFLGDVARLEPGFTTERPTDGDPGLNQPTITGTVTHQAVVPSSPIAPNLPLYLLVGALGGLLVSIGVIVYREAWREGGRGPSDAGDQ